MLSTSDTLSVERCAANARIRSVLRVLMLVVSVVALGAPLMAQEAGGGEANLKLPRLDSVTFLGGISGSSLLMGGLVVSALGLMFGLYIFTRLRAMPVHDSMREVSELIYETCKTYLATQGKFLCILEALIAVIIVFYFGFLLGFEFYKVLIILAFSVVGISGSFMVAAFGMRVNTFANSRTRPSRRCGASPSPAMHIPLQAGMSIGMLLVSVELLIMLCILLFVPGDLAGSCFIGFAIGESLGAAALRVAGGIFTKIADIGSDLMKIVFKIKEDDARNPGCDCRLHRRQRGRFGGTVGRWFRDLRRHRCGSDHLHSSGCRQPGGAGSTSGVDLHHAHHDGDFERRGLLYQRRNCQGQVSERR